MEIRKIKGMRKSKSNGRYRKRREKKEGKGKLPHQTLAARENAKETRTFI